MHKPLLQHNCQQIKKTRWNTDHAMFIGRGKPVLFFSKKLSRHQNSEILCYC